MKQDKPLRLDGYFVTLVASLLLGYIAIFSYLFYKFPDFYPISSLFFFLLTAFLIDGIKVIVESLNKPHKHKIKTEPEKVTVLIPCHNGADTIFETVQDIKKTLPEAGVIVADDASTDETAKLARSAGAKVFPLKENLGKVGAIHEALSVVSTPYVLVMDDDTRLGEAKVPTNLLKDYDAVSFRVLPHGNSLLSHFQRHEYRKSMEIGRGFHAKTGTIPCVSGAVGLFRKEALLRQTDLHSGEFSGEDLQRTLLIHRHRNGRGVTFVDEEVYTHPPKTLSELYLQRVHGWWPGLWNNFHHFLHLAFAPKVNWRLRYDSLYTLFLIVTDPFRILALPALFSSFSRFWTFYIFYVLLELIPYLRMGRREHIVVILLGPIYGIAQLFTRVVAFFAWIYRRVVAVSSRKRIPDSYKRASLAHQVFAFALGLIISVGLITAGTYPTLQGGGVVDYYFTRFENDGSKKQEEISRDTTTDVERKDVEVKEKIYVAVAKPGNGFMHVARELIAQFRNDFGGYEDPVVRLYAEDRIGRQLQAQFNKIDPGDTFSLPLGVIKEQLDKGTGISPNLYATMKSYLRG